jgi:hypothetical protein
LFVSAAALLPIHHAVSEGPTKQHTNSWRTANSPPKEAIVRTTAFDECQYPPTANPIPTIAEFQKNIDSGLPRLTLSFSVIALLLLSGFGALEIVRRTTRGAIEPHRFSLD